MTDTAVFAPGLFAGRHVLITGGATGLGYAIARELGGLGARVTLAQLEAVCTPPVMEQCAEGVLRYVTDVLVTVLTPAGGTGGPDPLAHPGTPTPPTGRSGLTP